MLGDILAHLISLHDRGVVVGDLQPGNVLVSSDLRACVSYLIDCDAFFLDGSSALPYLQPDMWTVPKNPARPSSSTDLAKFSLLAARALGENWAANGNHEVVFSKWLRTEWVDLLERMWNQDPSLRSSELRTMANGWRSFVSPSASGTIRMSHWPAGQLLKKEWSPPVTIGPEPQTGPKPLPTPAARDSTSPVSSNAAPLRSPKQGQKEPDPETSIPRPIVMAAAALLLAVVFILFIAN